MSSQCVWIRWGLKNITPWAHGKWNDYLPLLFCLAFCLERAIDKLNFSRTDSNASQQEQQTAQLVRIARSTVRFVNAVGCTPPPGRLLSSRVVAYSCRVRSHAKSVFQKKTPYRSCLLTFYWVVVVAGWCWRLRLRRSSIYNPPPPLWRGLCCLLPAGFIVNEGGSKIVSGDSSSSSGSNVVAEEAAATPERPSFVSVGIRSGCAREKAATTATLRNKDRAGTSAASRLRGG